MKVTVNDLESRRFGVRFGRLDAGPISHRELTDALAGADADGIRVISTRVDVSDLGHVRLLEDMGFRIMDTLVYYRRRLSADAGTATRPANPQIHDLTSGDAEACASVALRAFHQYLGHYHADPGLPDDAADDAYADWISRLLRHPVAGQIALGLRVDDRLVGFIVGQAEHAGDSEIVLNAVDPDHQRGGVYTMLLEAYLARARGRGDGQAIISTQLPNYPVQRVWHRAGFSLYQSFHTLHRWSSARPA